MTKKPTQAIQHGSRFGGKFSDASLFGGADNALVWKSVLFVCSNCLEERVFGAELVVAGEDLRAVTRSMMCHWGAAGVLKGGNSAAGVSLQEFSVGGQGGIELCADRVRQWPAVWLQPATRTAIGRFETVAALPSIQPKIRRAPHSLAHHSLTAKQDLACVLLAWASLHLFHLD
ncbi:hypothetical protein [Nocardia vinacea]|uniref:hypothetical protein n=1 Tax=Nocardia vinacea TaxID=96468 RepID=UPI000594471D|nr:hypothetical protein [Nocardia vinacea]